jgi:hypothetical protein
VEVNLIGMSLYKHAILGLISTRIFTLQR